jgi:hypothetical protein
MLRQQAGAPLFVFAAVGAHDLLPGTSMREARQTKTYVRRQMAGLDQRDALSRIGVSAQRRDRPSSLDPGSPSRIAAW